MGTLKHILTQGCSLFNLSRHRIRRELVKQMGFFVSRWLAMAHHESPGMESGLVALLCPSQKQRYSAGRPVTSR